MLPHPTEITDHRWSWWCLSHAHYVTNTTRRTFQVLGLLKHSVVLCGRHCYFLYLTDEKSSDSEGFKTWNSNYHESVDITREISKQGTMDEESRRLGYKNKDKEVVNYKFSAQKRREKNLNVHLWKWGFHCLGFLSIVNIYWMLTTYLTAH